MRIFALTALSAVLVTGHAHAANPVVLTSCGHTISNAVLAADLDCSTRVGFAVILSKGGTLDLAGHQLISGATGAPSFPQGGGVRCEGSCKILGGGGSIVSSVAPSTFYSIGVYGESNVRISDTTISGYWMAARAERLKIDSSTLSENLRGCEADGTLRLSNSTITCLSTPDQHEAAAATNVRIADSVLTSGDGVYGERVRIERSQVTTMDDWGVRAYGKLRASDSVIDGNCVATLWELCADVVGVQSRPRLINTTCSTSTRINSPDDSDTWGVCSLD